MVKEGLVDKLKKEKFNGREINWQVSERRGERMPYAETKEAYFFRMLDTGTLIVQPKNPSSAMPHCYSCDGNILTVVRDVHIKKTNGEEPGNPFYQEWIGQSLPVAIPYCEKCDKKPEGGQRFSSIEEFHRVYGKKFEEIIPTQSDRIS